MNYALADLEDRNPDLTKETLMKNGDTLDIVLKGRQDQMLPAIWRELADSIKVTGADGVVLAVLKSHDGVHFDRR